MVSHAGGGSSARRKSHGRPGRRLVLLEGGRSSSAPLTGTRSLPPAADALDLQHDLLALITKYQVLDSELRARLPQDVMRMVDALADAARDIAMIESSLGEGSYT